MYKVIAVFILCFTISEPLLAQAGDEVLQRLFVFQRTIAEQGDSEAMLILGDMYRKGEGTDVDLNIALYWYNQAARAGNKKAEQRIEQLLKRKDVAKKTQANVKPEKVAVEKGKRQDTKPQNTKQRDTKAIELENARKKAKQLTEQLARQRQEAEKARSDMERLKDLERQLSQERAAAEKARRDMEALKHRQEQLIEERKAAEQARIEAEKARLAMEQTAQNTENSAPLVNHEPDPAPESQEAVKDNVNTFKSNPCDNPKIRDSYSCKLLSRRH